MSSNPDLNVNLPSRRPIALAVTVISDYQAFNDDNFAEKYRGFLAQLGGVHPLLFSFESLSQGRPLYERRGDNPWFLVVFAEQLIVALLPLHLETFGVWPLQFRRLRLWGKIGCNNDLHPADFLARPDYAEQAAEVVVGYLQQELGRRFDEIHLLRIRADSALVRQIANRLPQFECDSKDEANYVYSGQIKLSQRITGETFRKIRKAREGLIAHFSNVEYVCVTHLTAELFDELAALHIARQKALVEQGRQRASFFEDRLEREVLFKRLCMAEQAGALRLYTLRLDGDLVCYLLCVGQAGSTLALITAFKEIVGHRYHARCLWHYAFQQELECFGTQMIDMGYGGHQLKQTFSTDLIPLKTISIKDPRNQLSALRRRGWRFAKQAKDYLKQLKREI